MAFLACRATLALKPYDQAVTCEPMKIDICQRDDFYNTTGFPNFAGHKVQTDAGEAIKTWIPLVDSNCAAELQLFLCIIHVPMCITENAQKLIGPCRPFCESVRRRCEPVQMKVSLKWPEFLNCQRFPEKNGGNGGEMCIPMPENKALKEYKKNTNNNDNYFNSVNSLQFNDAFKNKLKEVTADDKLSENENKNIIKLIDKYEDLVAPRKPLNMECQEFKNSFNYVKINKKGCILNCTNSDNIFTKDQKATTQTLIIVGAFLCLGLCLTTLIIYIMNCCSGESHSAATFANRSPVFLVFSYVGLSLGYLISQFGILNNPEWLCVRYDKDHLLAAQEGARSQPCIVIFLFVYFFGNAISAWWTLVAFVWALAQYCSPNRASMDRISMICHMYGWGVPAILTLVALLTHSIEADELTSVCLPGALQDDRSFLWFNIVPEAVQWSFAVVLFLSGIYLAFCCGDARTNEKIRGKTEAKALKNLRHKFSVLGFLYIVLKAGIFVTLLLEYYNRQDWLKMTSSPKDLPDIYIFWSRILLCLLCGCFMPFMVLNKQTKRTCLSIWNTNKTPSVVPSTFPTVAYTQTVQNMEMISLNDARMTHQRQNFL